MVGGLVVACWWWRAGGGMVVAAELEGGRRGLGKRGLRRLQSRHIVGVIASFQYGRLLLPMDKSLQLRTPSTTLQHVCAR